MDYTTYKIIHLTTLAALMIGLGGMMAGGNNRKIFSILQGLALLVMLVSGFGLLARLHLGFPHFAMVKVGLWIVIGALPVLLRRLQVPVWMRSRRDMGPRLVNSSHSIHQRQRGTSSQSSIAPLKCR